MQVVEFPNDKEFLGTRSSDQKDFWILVSQAKY